MDTEESNRIQVTDDTVQELVTGSEAPVLEPALSPADDGPVSRSSTAPLPVTEAVGLQPESLVDVVETTGNEVEVSPSAAPEAPAEMPEEVSRISTEPIVESDQSEILASSSSHAEQPYVSSVRTEQEAHGVQSHSDVSALDSLSAEADVQPTVSASTAAEQRAASADHSAQQPSSAPSPAQVDVEAVPFAHATFVVPTENWKHLQIVPLATTAAEIKHSLCSNWSISESALSVKYNRQELKDHQSLASCGIQEGQEVDIELVIHYQMLSTPHAKHKAEPKAATLPRSLEVHVLEGPQAQVRTVKVNIDVSQKQSKAYKGGYRDKRNGTLYHHADCQTDKQAAGGPRAQRAERECQTKEVKQRGNQTVREAHVQMARPDLLMDTSRDRTLTARPYVSADEVWAEKERCAAIIQRYTRGWLARNRVRFMLKEARQGSAAAARAAAQAAEQEAAHRRHEAQRRLQPRTTADFTLLHSELEAWRLAETARIKAAGLSPEECHQALCHLLHQETKLLQSIDRMRGEADIVRKEQRVREALAHMTQAKAWPLSNGGILEVHTPATTRAGELRGLYRGLQLQGLAAGERLDVLLHVKFCAKEFDCALTRELVQLIDREADLINRGRKSATMEGLRKRISTLFLQFIENPAFNPEAANFFNLSVKTCSTENYMYTGMAASDSDQLAAKSLLV